MQSEPEVPEQSWNFSPLLCPYLCHWQEHWDTKQRPGHTHCSAHSAHMTHKYFPDTPANVYLFIKQIVIIEVIILPQNYWDLVSNELAVLPMKQSYLWQQVIVTNNKLILVLEVFSCWKIHLSMSEQGQRHLSWDFMYTLMWCIYDLI